MSFELEQELQAEISKRRHLLPSSRLKKQSINIAQSHYNLGQALAAQEQWEDAIAAYQEAIRLQPQWVEPRQALGEIFLKLEQWQQAISCYQQLIEIQPESAQVHHSLGDALSKLEQWEDAVSAYQKAIQFNPEFSWSYNNLGDALLKLEQWENATSAYQRAIALKPDFALSYHNLGEALTQLEDWENAVIAYQKAIDLDYSFFWSYYNLGEAFTHLEKWEQAIQNYRKAINLNPDLPRVHEKLGDALQQQIQVYSKESINLYHQVIKKEPDNIKAYHKALEIQQDSSELYLGLSQALEQQGEKEQAIVFRDLAWHQVSQKKVARRLDKPTFSIVIPIYDRTQLLYETLVSLCNQTYQNFEVILVLDGSPLETRAVVEKFTQDSRFRVFSYPEPSGNACRGRNRGIIEAQGKYIALTDSDDISTPNRLQITLNTFEENNCDAVVGKARYIIDNTRINSPVEMLSENEIIPLIYPVLKRVNPIVTSTISIRRDVLLKYGGFRPEMRYREDHELWLRLSFHECKMVFVNHLFALYRLHESNNELNFKKEDHHWVKMMHYYYSQPITNWGI